jgi:amino acid adenylation domain-containing protein
VGGECVAIVLPRCVQALVAQLAILKAGGVYVPIDPQFPALRQGLMIRDCGARQVLGSGRSVLEAGLEGSARWLDLEESQARIDQCPSHNPGLPWAGTAVAYVMYTSGSRGLPKGVEVPHRGISRLAINNGYARIGARDCVAHCSNLAFDASTFEIWGALLNGARVLVIPHAVVMDSARLNQTLVDQQASVLWLTVGLFNSYRASLGEAFSRLNYLIVGGDALDPVAVREVLERSPPRHLLNGYGPTECTTFAATYEITRLAEGVRGIPIGRPIANTRIYLLDRWRQPVPLGAVGEIYIGGAGVALGYLNRPELTAERFVEDRLSGEAQGRLYRTGDLGRYREDGNLEFLGRTDEQVKIRGFRVELGEIEACLQEHPQIKEAAVLAREDEAGEKRLVAYVVTAEDLAASLRSYLEGRLPQYMVPAAFVRLERLPLTANGKVDRQGLPAPLGDAYARGAYEAPQGEVEVLLAGVWQELLGVERVGRHDNFFELGGHSLLAIRLVTRAEVELGCRIELSTLFRSPTLAEFSKSALIASIEQEFEPPEIQDLLQGAAES